MHIAYVRVSTQEQNEARQMEALEKHEIDKWFTEKISGKNTDRPQFRAINEFERTNLLERQREGIAIAKRQGKYKGRKEIPVADFPAQYARYMNREVSKSQLAAQLGISRPTLDKLIRQQEINGNRLVSR